MVFTSLCSSVIAPSPDVVHLRASMRLSWYMVRVYLHTARNHPGSIRNLEDIQRLGVFVSPAIRVAAAAAAPPRVFRSGLEIFQLRKPAACAEAGRQDNLLRSGSLTRAREI